MALIEVEERFNHWDRVIARAPKVTSQYIRKATLDLYALSQMTAPVRRPDVEKATGVTGGFLKNSGVVKTGGHEGEVAYTAFYAGYVHDGTVKMPARPFLRDALSIVVPQLIAAFRGLEGDL